MIWRRRRGWSWRSARCRAVLAHPGVPLLRLRGGGPEWGPDMGASVGAGADVGGDAERLAALRRRFVIAPSRNFEQDPRFGVLALTEIASRALSPAVNDPGTAIDILGRHLRILALWQERAEAEVAFPALWVPPLRLSDLMTDAFAAIARDGAGLIEVQIRLQKTLAGLVAQAPWVFGPDAQRLSDRALRLAEAALVLEEDRDALRLLAAEVAAAASGAAAGRSLGRPLARRRRAAPEIGDGIGRGSAGGGVRRVARRQPGQQGFGGGQDRLLIGRRGGHPSPCRSPPCGDGGQSGRGVG